MTDTAQKETLGFQTEVSKLLHLMIHSLSFFKPSRRLPGQNRWL